MHYYKSTNFLHFFSRIFWGKKDNSDRNQIERRFLTERKCFLGKKTDRKKAISDRKKGASEGNLTQRRRFLTERTSFSRRETSQKEGDF